MFEFRPVKFDKQGSNVIVEASSFHNSCTMIDDFLNAIPLGTIATPPHCHIGVGTVGAGGAAAPPIFS